MTKTTPSRFYSGKTMLFVAFVFLFPALQSCYHKNTEIVPKPQRLIPHDTMVSILTDLQLIEGIVSYDRINRVNNKNMKEAYFNKVLEHYGITKEQLRDNLNYYDMQYDEMAEMYDEVIARLTETEARLKARQKAEKKKKAAPSLPPSPLWNNIPSDSLFKKNEESPRWIFQNNK